MAVHPDNPRARPRHPHRALPGARVLAVPARADAHGGGHGLVVAEGQLYRPLHLLNVVEILDNDEVNVIVYEDLEPFPQLLMDFFFALAIPISTGYSLHISTYLSTCTRQSARCPP